jgi:hypothetical protein
MVTPTSANTPVSSTRTHRVSHTPKGSAGRGQRNGQRQPAPTSSNEPGIPINIRGVQPGDIRIQSVNDNRKKMWDAHQKATREINAPKDAILDTAASTAAGLGGKALGTAANAYFPRSRAFVTP